jgi:hypothetical protein
MPDNNEAIPEPILTEVVIDDPYEVRRWCQRFICTEAQLRAAVGAAGTDPAAVRSALTVADRRAVRSTGR